MFESYEIAHYFHSPTERKSTELCGLRNYDRAIPTHLLIGPMNNLTDFRLPILANKKGRRVNTLNSSYKTPSRGNSTRWKSVDSKTCSTEMS